MENKDLKYWIAFSKCDFDSTYSVAAYNYFGSIQEAWYASIADIAQIPEIGYKRAENLAAAVAEERLILHLMFNNNRLEYITARISANDFVTKFNARVFKSVCDAITRNNSFEIGMLAETYSPEEMGRIAKIQSSSSSLANTVTECDDCIKRIKEEKRKKEQVPASEMDDEQFKNAFIRKKKN